MLHEPGYQILNLLFTNMGMGELEELEQIIEAEKNRRRGISGLTAEEIVVAGTNKIEAIRMIRRRLGLGLKEAKDMVDMLPNTLPKRFSVALSAVSKFAPVHRVLGVEVVPADFLEKAKEVALLKFKELYPESSFENYGCTAVQL